MAMWEVTEKTMLCEEIASVVTVIVQGDGQSRCTGYKKFVANRNKNHNRTLKKLSKKCGRELKCSGLSCSLVKNYREELKV